MSARSELLEKLNEELAMGWPTPWHEADARAARADLNPRLLHPAHVDALSAYVALVADLLEEATDHHGTVIPLTDAPVTDAGTEAQEPNYFVESA